MSTAFSMNDDLDINEVVEFGDELADQSTSDVMESARRVPFKIAKASVRRQLEDNKQKEGDNNNWLVKWLRLDVVITDSGIDGEGAYSGKHLFPELRLAFNNADFPERYLENPDQKKATWWRKNARGPVAELFKALGFDVKAMPPVDADFIAGLVGMEFVADIRKKPRQQRGEDNKYHDVEGEFENELQNFRSAS